ncbi:Gfo/Idh/MocA family protein [Natronolimnobius baerhuensis]|uniref:Oxidoreductase n=1 Tax=Natronolimnobius baerhuensis TaxID=253108 RepID=A0A202EAX9_9EURY|nr:Gfo/Idh/MocA family oxidoreductase [Natronolimnobius baerhuensis]OVE85433.1 oxidoreductase [Natronolimnobius baerhuensis]
MNTRQQLTIGIVGLGSHGTRHSRALQELGHDVMGADADPTIRADFAAEFDTTTFEHPSNLFDEPIDAVIISSPTKFHEPVATKALEAGLDVLLEKPLAHTVESAERIAQVAERTDQVCMVGYHHRFRNPCTVLKDYIDQGYLGDITHIQAKYIRRRGVPGRGTWYTSREIAGGGALMDLGSHALDMVLYFCDWPAIEDVLGQATSEFGPREDYSYLDMWGEDGEARMYDVEDSVHAFLEFENGCTASIEVAWATNAESVHSYDVRGTEAGASLDITNTLDEIDPWIDHRNDLTLYEVRGGAADHFVNSEIVCEQNDPFRDELATFLETVVTDTRPAQCNVRQALQAQRAVDRVYQETDA